MICALLFLWSCGPCFSKPCTEYKGPGNDSPTDDVSETVTCQALNLRWHLGNVNLSGLEWSPAETQFSGFDSTGFQRFLRASNGGEQFSVFFDQFNRFTGWQNGDVHAEMSTAGQLRLLEPENGNIVDTIDHGFGIVPATAWQTGNQQAALANGRQVAVWSRQQGDVIQQLQEHEHDVKQLAWSALGLLASSDEDGVVIIWNDQSWNPVTTIVVSSVGVTNLRWVSGSNDLLVTLAGGETRRYQGDTWQQIATIVEGTVHSDGSVFAIIDEERTLGIYGSVSGSLLCSVPLQNFRSPTRLQWAATSDAIAVYGIDVAVWDIVLSDSAGD